MNNKQRLKVGDKIIEQGEVYRIFKVNKREGKNGQSQKVIFFKPYFKKANTINFVCSIPVENIEKAKIRKPMSKERIKKIIEKLNSKYISEAMLSVDAARDVLNSDVPSQTASIVRDFWGERIKNPESFNKSKRDVFELAFDRLAQEIALVNKISFEKAKEKISHALEA